MILMAVQSALEVIDEAAVLHVHCITVPDAVL